MRGRVDANHREVVQALRDIGASVVSLADLGDGCGDLLAGYRGQNFFFEVKDGSLPPSRRKLTPLEKSFHDSWRGQIDVVESARDAVNIVLNSRPRA